MNEFSFRDLACGQEAGFSAHVTQEKMDLFRQLSGDTNPLHLDVHHARSRGHSGCLVYGMLVAAFLSQLVGVHLPGKNALLHGVKISFLRPVLVGDVLEVRGRVTHLNEAYRQVELEVTIVNQQGARVAKATVAAGVHV
jgi:3-hydroxybutyryl-CoA dehydratase